MESQEKSTNKVKCKDLWSEDLKEVRIRSLYLSAHEVPRVLIKINLNLSGKIF